MARFYEVKTDNLINLDAVKRITVYTERPGRIFIVIMMQDGEVLYRGPFATRALVNAEIAAIKTGGA